MTSRSNTLLKTAAWFAGILPDGVKRLLYRLPFLAKPIRTALNAAAPDGYTLVEIASGPAKGFSMGLDLHAEKDYWLGTYEPDLRDTAQKLIQPGDVIYDVGANIGYISLLCASLSGPHGRVFSFEALPANIGRLTANVKINHLESRIAIIHAAVTDHKGPVTFYTHRSGAMGKAEGSAGRDEEYRDSITVDGIALDDFMAANQNRGPELIKMDIEGGEGNALRGSVQLISAHKPTFLVELHGEVAASQVWDILSQNDYQIHTLQNGYPRINSLHQLDWKAYIVAIHPSKAARLT
jgi:FkbM family methyltransferase